MEDVAEEAASLGEVDRLDVYSKHPEGVFVVKYKSAGAAVDAISTFHNRWFGGRRITCEYWDGKTDYKWVVYLKIRCFRDGYLFLLAVVLQLR